MTASSLKRLIRPAFAFAIAVSASACTTINSTPFQTSDVDEYDKAEASIMDACPQLQTVKTKLVPADFLDVVEAENITGYETIETIPLEPSKPEYEHYGEVATTLYNLNEGDAYIIDINSYGGLMNVANYLSHAMKSTKGRVVTIADGNNSSAASVLSSSGTKNYRYIYNDTVSILHSVRDEVIFENPVNPKAKEKTKVFFEEDYAIGSDDRKSLAAANERLRKHYQAVSATKINALCAKTLTQGKIDVSVTPDALLTLGLVDKVLFPTSETMLVRSDYTPG